MPLDAAEVAITGLAQYGAGDREWMAVDRDGRFVTQREFPRLALVDIALDGKALVLSAPDAAAVAVPLAGPATASRDVTVWHSDVRGVDQGDAVAAWLSAFLESDLRLVRFDRATPRRCNPDYAGASGAHTFFADGYPILVIGSASLVDLNARLQAHGEQALPMNRFRPNLVVTGLDPYAEDHVETVACGPVMLKLVKPCTRCQVTTTDQASGRVGIEPLPTLSTYRRNDALGGVTFGMNAIVAAGAGGTIAVGAPVTIDYRF